MKMLYFKIFLSVFLSSIVMLSYFAIRDINNSENSENKKRKWVMIILYFPIVGALYYFYKKR